MKMDAISKTNLQTQPKEILSLSISVNQYACFLIPIGTPIFLPENPLHSHLNYIVLTVLEMYTSKKSYMFIMCY